MIKLENNLGIIEISEKYFSSIICKEISSCFGVADIAVNNAPRKGVRAIFDKFRHAGSNGIVVRKDGNGLSVDLHIIVTYGLNISATVKSIVNRVRYTVEQSTTLEVKRVNVFVDGMVKN